jgi:peptidoglycan/LPS O-acetylase OafA/YrhL
MCAWGARLPRMHSATSTSARQPGEGEHLAVLDGWRGISILLVLASHLLPLGPKAWQFNDVAGAAGMALFFTLSGFLITRFLLTRDSVTDFLIRRLFRIVPLAWLGMAVALRMADAPPQAWLPHLLFYANLPPQALTEPGAHLWSLCVEVQFYVGIAVLVLALGKARLKWVIPLLALAVTTHRLAVGATIDIVTWRRLDEILAGALLALAWQGEFGSACRAALGRPRTWAVVAALAVGLLLASHPRLPALNYARPYLAALLVGATLAPPPPTLARLLQNRWLAYVAEISYALYVIHHLLIHTWLGTGERLVKYAKRPLLIAATFALAHLSTFHFERHCIALGKRLSAHVRRQGLARSER